MNKLIFFLFPCIGIQIENGFSMMDVDSSPVPHKKIISKGFKPPSSPSNKKPVCSKKTYSF